MNEEQQPQNKPQQQESHEITKLNRQADVLDQTRLRPPITSSRATIINCLIKLKSPGVSAATIRLVNYRLLYLDRRCNFDSSEEAKIAHCYR